MFRCRGILAKSVSLVLLVAFPQFLVSCTYYHLAEAPHTSPLSLEKGSKIVLHQHQRMLRLGSYTLDGQTLKGVPAGTWGADRAPEERTTQASVAHEVHLYLSDATPLPRGEGPEVTVPLSEVEKIMVYHVSAGKTAASWGASTLGVAAVVVALLVVVAAASKGASCPFVYASNPGGEVFAGEIYSGALYPELERHDYLALPGIEPVDGRYQLRVTNEVREIQHTNLLELLVADHPADVQVLFDKRGMPHTIRAPQAPVTAASSLGQPALEHLLAKDGATYGGVPRQDRGALKESLVLTFQRPGGAVEGKLVLRARNSIWLDYAYVQYLGSLGEEREQWQAEQRRGGREGFARWASAQGTRVAVSLGGPGGWSEVDSFPVVGPMGFRDLVLPIALGPDDAGPLRVKLEFGFGFWELDYAAMDFTPNAPVHTTRIGATSATDQDGRDVLPLLRSDDGRYLDQPRIGDAVVVRFPAPATAQGAGRSIALHAKGHYEILPPLADSVPPAVSRLGKSASFLEFSKDLRAQLFAGVGTP